jgi:glucose/sorbosone dehydrogenase
LLFVGSLDSVHAVSQGVLLPEPALVLPDPGSRIVGLAVDPRFEDSHAVFVAWTQTARSGGSVLNIARYRELQHMLGQGAVIVSGVPMLESAIAPLAVDESGLMYVAVPGNASDIGSLEPFTGTILRFDQDGRSASVNATMSPAISRGQTEPSALAVDTQGRLWLGGKSTNAPPVAVVSVRTPPLLQRVSGVAPASFSRATAQSIGPLLAVSRGGQQEPRMLVATADGVAFAKVSEGRLYDVRMLTLGHDAAFAGSDGGRDQWFVVTGQQASGTVLRIRRMF